MNSETLKAIKKANQFLNIIEQVTAHYDNELELATSIDQDQNPFYHLGKITQQKYGSGIYLSLLLMQQSLNTMLYFQGKLDEESYQECKAYIEQILEELDTLTQPPANTYIH